MKEEIESPPFEITSSILSLVAEIMELLGKLTFSPAMVNPKLRRENQLKTIQASLAIENNSLSLEQVTDIIYGKRVLGKASEIKEVKNAFQLYEEIERFNPYKRSDLLEAHKILMRELVPNAGELRSSSVGIAAGDKIVHIAPPAHLVPSLLSNLLKWVQSTDYHPLIKSCVFHYEFEFIHPFMDGNGRMGRLWQSIILSKWKEIFLCIPVETIVRERQVDYYRTLAECDEVGNSTQFIEFMLQAIRKTLFELKETDQACDQLSDQVKRLLSLLKKEPKTAIELMSKLGLSHRPTFRKNYLIPALEHRLIELTQPDKPNSPTQKYRITLQGVYSLKKNYAD